MNLKLKLLMRMAVQAAQDCELVRQIAIKEGFTNMPFYIEFEDRLNKVSVADNSKTELALT